MTKKIKRSKQMKKYAVIQKKMKLKNERKLKEIKKANLRRISLIICLMDPCLSPILMRAVLTPKQAE